MAILAVVGGVVAAIVVAIVLLMGGDDDEGPQVAGTATPEEPGGTATPGATGTPEEQVTPSGDAEQDLVALGEAAGDATFRVEFAVSGPQGTGTLVVYNQRPNFRIDFDAPVQGEEQSGSFILRPPNAYLCSVTEGQGGCLDISAFLGDVAGQFVPEDPEGGGLAEGELDFAALLAGNLDLGDILAQQSGDFEAVEVEGREVAGIEGRCIRITPAAGAEVLEGEAEFCFSDDGVPLFISFTTEEGVTEFSAVNVSDDVSEGDFEPPYPITEGGLF